MAATSADSLAHVDASHSPTKPKDIEYPVSSKSKPDKEKHKADLLKANTETLYADLNRNKEITNLIFLTNSPEAWLNAIQEHYPDIKKDGRKEKGCLACLKLESDDGPTSIHIYHTGNVLIQGNWTTFANAFTEIKEKAHTLHTPHSEDTHNEFPNRATIDSKIDPTLLTRLEEKFHELEIKQVQMEQTLLEHRRGQLEQGGSLSAKEDTEMASLRQAVKLLQDNESKLKIDIAQLRHDTGKEVHQLWERMELMERDLRKEREARERELSELRESMRKETGLLRKEIERLKEETRSPLSNQQERVGTAENNTDNSLSQPGGQSQEPSLETSQLEEAQPSTPTTELKQPESPQIVLLTDSNGKFLETKKLFPKHRVAHVKCSNYKHAMKLLTGDQLGSPSHIIIHTGTNDIWKLENYDMVKTAKRMIEKAIKTFPNTKVVISALLPRWDVEHDYINEINAKVSHFCATTNNVYFASHPTLSRGSLTDKVHICKAAVPTFAKKLKDIALNRSSPDVRHKGNRATNNTPRQPSRSRHHRGPARPQGNPPTALMSIPLQPPGAFRKHPNTLHTGPSTYTASLHQTHASPLTHTPTYAQVVKSPSQNGTITLTKYQLQQLLMPTHPGV